MNAHSVWAKAQSVELQVSETIMPGFNIGFDKNIPAETEKEMRAFVSWVEDNYRIPITLRVDFEYKHYLRSREGKRVGYLFYWADFASYPTFSNPEDIPVIRLPVRTEHSTMEEILSSFIEAIMHYYAWICNELNDEFVVDQEDVEEKLKAYLQFLQENRMEDYIEDYDNQLAHVFAEFVYFLYVSLYDFKKDKMLHNIMVNTKRIHIRTLADFFSEERKDPDDLIYKDFLLASPDLHIEWPKGLKRFINKSTAHLSQKRGRIEMPDGFVQISKDIIKSIYRFMEEINRGNIKPEFKKALSEETAKEIQQSINILVLKISVVNALNGMDLEL